MGPEFNIRAVIQLTGINEHTLRAWERRYEVVQPDRTPSGRRLYSQADVERLRMIARLVEGGRAIGLLATKANDELAALLRDELPPLALAGGKTDEAQARRATAVLAAIKTALAHYRLEEIYDRLQEARVQLGARLFVLDIVAPLMSTIGGMVAARDLSVAQEHALSAIVKSHLMELLFSLRRAQGQAQGGAIALATIEGDLHEMGILIAATLCAHYGRRVVYLGPNMPPDALVELLRAMRTSTVLIGVTTLLPGVRAWSVKSYIGKLAKDLPKQHGIWVGGSSGLDLGVAVDKRIQHFPSFHELDAHLAEEV